MLESDRELLLMLAKRCKNPDENIRLFALHAVSAGNSVRHVAEVFGVNEQTVRRWITRWREVRDLSNKDKSGRPPKLTEMNRKELRWLIKESSPVKQGLNASAWDTKELQSYFENKGIIVSRELIRQELVKMGAHYVKAQITFAQADEKARQEFASELLKTADSLDSDAVLLFEDEMSACCSPRKGYGWTFEKRLVITAPQTHNRLNVFGAVNPLQGDIIQLPTKHAKAPSFIKLLKRIICAYPKKRIWLYVDGCNVHKSKLVKQFLEMNPRLEIRFMPSYSPDMNPAELLWLLYRKKLLNNRYFKTTHELACNLHAFARRCSQEQILQVCNLNPIRRALY